MKASGLVIEGLNKSSGDVHVVKDLNLTVEPGQFLVLLGPSGCGKTTALRMIAGLEEAADPDNSKKEFSWAACEGVV